MRSASGAGEIPLHRDVQVPRRAGRPRAAIVHGCTGAGYRVGPMQSTEFQYYFCTQGLLMILEVLFAALNRGFKDFCNVKN